MRNQHRIPIALLAAFGLGVPTSLSAQQIPPTMPERAQLSGVEQHPTILLPEVKSHWIYYLDFVFPHIIASKVYVIDGDTLQYVGMLNTGYTPNLVLAHDRSAVYVVETYWSRGTRGERSDMVTFYDPKTFEVTGEVRLPKGRFLIVPKKPNADITTDGRYLLSFNMDPSTSVSLIDTRERRYVGELETPGCAHVFPNGPSSFAMLCADGSFAVISFDASGKAEVENGQPFFNTDEDPVFEHVAMHRPSGKAFFVSYNGWVYPVDFTSRQPKVGERFRLQGQGEEGWRPGGWQLAAYHAGTNRLFVQMHEGGRWTHKQAGKEIWVFDVTTKRRVHRIGLDEPSVSISVTQDEAPLLFSFSETRALSVFDAKSYEHKGTKEKIGDEPPAPVLYVFGE